MHATTVTPATGQRTPLPVGRFLLIVAGGVPDETAAATFA